MSFIENIIQQAKADKKSVVLTESTDVRILKAGAKAQKEGTADIIFVGNKSEILKIAQKEDINLEGTKIVEPNTHPKLEEYIDKYFEIYKRFIVDKEEARNNVLDPLIFGMMMVKDGEADAYIAGATHSTKDVLQPTMKIFKTIGTRILSTVTTIEYKSKDFGNKDGIFLISDCALNADPGYLALDEIAKATANTYKAFVKKSLKLHFYHFLHMEVQAQDQQKK